MIIAVASGKGGTGKTTVAVNLAVTLKEQQEDKDVSLLDCDVEEPNVHLFLDPVITDRYPVKVPIPRLDQKKCNSCGRCSQVCAFNALAVIKNKVIFYPNLCHGCGSCLYFCPEKALWEGYRITGTVQEGYYGKLKTVQGTLQVGEAMAVPVIREVKAHQEKTPVTLIDVPPGTSCPVIASLQGIDYCLVVTEPTPFGLHDLGLLVMLLQEMGIPFGIVINRYDLGDSRVEAFCREKKFPLLLKIPFDREIAYHNAGGEILVEMMPRIKGLFQGLWQKIQPRGQGGGDHE